MEDDNSIFKMFVKNEKVRILGLEFTSQTFGSCSEMKKMVGKIYEIRNNPKDESDGVLLNNYYWDHRDLFCIDNGKYRSRFMRSKLGNVDFDPKILDC